MKARHLRVIREIQDSIPKDLLMRLTKMEIQAPTIKKIVESALTKPDEEVSPKQKRRMRALLDSAMLDRQVEVLDYDIEKQIDALITAGIDEAVKQGRLPKKAPTLELLNNKGMQYARRQEKRLRALALGKSDDVVGSEEISTEDEGEHPSREGDGIVLHSPTGDDRTEGTIGEARDEGDTARG